MSNTHNLVCVTADTLVLVLLSFDFLVSSCLMAGGW